MEKDNNVSIATVVPDLEIHADPELHCKVCNKDFKNAHAKTMHNVVVHEKRGFLATGKRKKGKTIKTSKGKLKCPHCPKTFLRATGLGSHMRTHGIKGNSKSVLALREKMQPKPRKGYCEPCNKTFKGRAGLAIHNAQVHNSKTQILKPEGTIIHANGNSVENSQTDARHFTYQDIHVSYLAGEVTERIRIYCEGNQLPTTLIANRVATQILRSTSR
jgi:hypothetical protein